MRVGEIWERTNPISKILFVLIILYLAVSVYVLLCGLHVVNNILTSDEDVLWIGYSILSFALGTLVATYHLSTMIFRRKRITDKIFQESGF